MHDGLTTFCLIPNVETVDRLAAQFRRVQGEASAQRLVRLLPDYPRQILESQGVLISGPPSSEQRERLRQFYEDANDPCPARVPDRDDEGDDLFERVCHWDYEASGFTLLACNLAAVLEFLGETDAWSAVAADIDEPLRIEMEFRRKWLERLEDVEARLGDEDFARLGHFRVPSRVLTGNIRNHFVELFQLREARHLLLATTGVLYELSAEALEDRSGSEPWDAVLLDPATHQRAYLELTEANPPTKQGAPPWGKQRHAEALVDRGLRRLLRGVHTATELGYTITLKSGSLPTEDQLDATCADLEPYLLRGELPPPAMPVWIARIERSPTYRIAEQGEWTVESDARPRPTAASVLQVIKAKVFRKDGSRRVPLPGAGFLFVRLNPTDSSREDFDALGEEVQSNIGTGLFAALAHRGFLSVWLVSEAFAMELWAAGEAGFAATGGDGE